MLADAYAEEKRRKHLTYPVGMDLMWDPITKLMTVIFDEKPVAILGPFPDRQHGILAGEDHCRRLGWKSHDVPRE
jgi:hypothetical protein